MPTPLTTAGEVAAAEAATVTPASDLLASTQQLVNFTIPVEDLPTAGSGSVILSRIASLYAPFLAWIEGLEAAIHALSLQIQALLPAGQPLDHLTMSLSSSSVMETETPPTLTLGQYQTSDSSTPYTDTLSPADAFSSSAPSVATIGATSGLITLHGPGTTTFTRTAGGKSVTADLTVTAEILSSTPSSLSGSVGGTSTALVIKDQSGVDVTAGCAFASSNTAIATVDSSGVVTYVAAGTCNIVVTHSIDGETCTVGVAVSAVTAVTPIYNSADVSNGMLAFTGTTYQLSAKDQSGNVVTGTWASAPDPTNVPVDNTGLLAPTAGAGGSTLTFTHASGHTCTVPVSVVVQAPGYLLQDAATNYASTADLMTHISSAVTADAAYNANVPSGTGASIYSDGFFANRIEIDSTTQARQFMGSPTFRMTISNGSGNSGCLRTAFTRISRVWGITVNRFDPGFNMVGTGGGASSYKITPWFAGYDNGNNGEVGPSGSNGNNSGGTAGAPGGNYNTTSAAVISGSVVGGGAATTIGNITSEFGAGEWWVDAILFEIVSGSILSQRWWHFKLGQAPQLMDNAGVVPHGWVEGPMDAGQTLPNGVNSLSMFGENMNQSAVADYHRAYGPWKVASGITYGDPFGILGDTSTPTLSSISVSSLEVGQTSQTISFTGTGYTENCWPVFSNPGVVVQSRTLTSGTSFSVVVNVAAGATPSVGTVAMYNSSSATTSGTQPFTVAASTVTSVAITPTPFTVYVGTTFQLTAKDQSGNVLVSGVTWSSSDGTKMTVSSSGLVTGVASGTATITAAYTGATSGTAAGTATATVGTTIPVTTGLVLQLDVSQGVTASGGFASVVADQSPTGTSVVQATGALQPALVPNVFKGGTMPALVFTGVEYMLSAANVPALNTATCTEFAVLQNTNTSGSPGDCYATSNIDLAAFTGVGILLPDHNARYGIQHGSGTASTDLTTASPAIDTTTLHSMGGSFTTGAQKLYVDGSQGNSDSVAVAGNTTQPIGIGTHADSPGTGNFKGKFAEWDRWSRVLTTAEVALMRTYYQNKWGSV